MEVDRLRLVYFLFSFAALIQSLSANTVQRELEEAVRASQKYYDPDPAAVASHLNRKVQEVSASRGSARELLSAEGGGCEATNPIDKCWRCQPNWAENRQALAGCALGFGKGATGGKGGQIYEVTDPSDDDAGNPKEGTLRAGVVKKEPLWIIFAKDMNIKLSTELIIQSDKTIDGRGANVHITGGGGITIEKVNNVIIHGIHIHNVSPMQGGKIMLSTGTTENKGPCDGDGIAVFASSNVWIDHCTLSEGQDGLLDVTQGSTAVTISNNHFSKHDKTILLGASDTHEHDKKMQVTLAFNRFAEGLVQRLPAVRFGFAHVVNNDYYHWKMYAIGGQSAPTILSQGNRFTASEDTKEVTKRIGTDPAEYKNWIWKSEKDEFLNGAFFTPSGDQNAQIAQLTETIEPQAGTEVERLTKFSGVLLCKPGQPC